MNHRTDSLKFYARRDFLDVVWSADPDKDLQTDMIAANLGIDPKTLLVSDWSSDTLGIVNGRLAFVYLNGVRDGVRSRWISGRAGAPWRFERASRVGRVYLTKNEGDCLRLLDAGIEIDQTVACASLPDGMFPAAWARLFRGMDVVMCFEADCHATRRILKLITIHARTIVPMQAEKSFLNRTRDEVLAERAEADALRNRLLSRLSGTGDDGAIPESAPTESEKAFTPERIRAVTTKLNPSRETIRTSTLRALHRHVTPDYLAGVIGGLPDEARAEFLRQFGPQPVRRTVKIVTRRRK